MPATARADELDDFLLARDAFLGGEYPTANTRFELLLGAGASALSPELRERARGYFAASLLAANRASDATTQLESLLRENPDARLEQQQQNQLGQNFVLLFGRTRERLAGELAVVRQQREEARQQAARDQERYQASLRAFLTTERLVFRTPLWSAPLPLGVAQFYAGDSAAGHAFLWTGVAMGLVAAGATAATAVEEGRLQLDPTTIGIHCSENPLICALRPFRAVGWSLFGASLLTGMIHGIATYRPERVQTRPRSMPPELERPRAVVAPSAYLGPDGAGAGLRLAF